MNWKIDNNVLAVRLYSGEDLIGSLKKVSETAGETLAAVVSGAGMFRKIKLGFFEGKGKYAERDYLEPHEIVSLTGNILRRGAEVIPHLHVSVADREGCVYGGHLMKAEVHGTCELFILLTGLQAAREFEEDTGLRGLKL